MNTAQLRKLLASVEVGSMVEIVGWDVLDLDAGGVEALGWLVCCRFRRPDRDTSKKATGAGRYWHVDSLATKEQVCRTAFAAVQMLVTHEFLEFFKVDGERVFDPHERNVAHGEPGL